MVVTRIACIYVTDLLRTTMLSLMALDSPPPPSSFVPICYHQVRGSVPMFLLRAIQHKDDGGNALEFINEGCDTDDDATYNRSAFELDPDFREFTFVSLNTCGICCSLKLCDLRISDTVTHINLTGVTCTTFLPIALLERAQSRAIEFEAAGCDVYLPSDLST